MDSLACGRGCKNYGLLEHETFARDYVHFEILPGASKLTGPYGDLSDSIMVMRITQQERPDAVYNYGAQSHIAVSFESLE